MKKLILLSIILCSCANTKELVISCEQSNMIRRGHQYHKLITSKGNTYYSQYCVSRGTLISNLNEKTKKMRRKAKHSQ